MLFLVQTLQDHIEQDVLTSNPETIEHLRRLIERAQDAAQQLNELVQYLTRPEGIRRRWPLIPRRSADAEIHVTQPLEDLPEINRVSSLPTTGRMVYTTLPPEDHEVPPEVGRRRWMTSQKEILRLETLINNTFGDLNFALGAVGL